ACPLALAYAQYVNCPHRTQEDSCGECPSCVQISELSHPDLHFVMPTNKAGKKAGEVTLSDDFVAQWRALVTQRGGYLSAEEWYASLDLGKTLMGVISAKETDSIVKKLSFKSYTGGYKIVVIWQAEILNEQASNKLLKLLEEPWERTLFILITENADRLLETIRSRCQRLDVRAIQSDELTHYVAEQGASDTQKLKSLVRLSGGDITTLRTLLEGQSDSQRTENFALFTSLMRLCYNDKHLELLEWAEEVSALTRDAQRSMLTYSLSMLREAYIIHAGVEEISYLWGEESSFCSKFAPFIGNQNIEFLMGEIENAMRQINQNGNATIIFTHFALTVSKQINRLK
ncbi:MAG: DNA polymerase III subunit delta, partial [Rikenellaceae bacterium]